MAKVEIPEMATDTRVNNDLARTNGKNTSAMTTEKGDGVQFAPSAKQLSKDASLLKVPLLLKGKDEHS